MSTFALDVNSSPGDIISGLNYAISNLGQGISAATANVLVANITTGEITTTSTNSSGYTSTTVVSYLYQYMNVKYANTSTGSSGFSSNSINKSYYGLRNTANTTISSNPTDYVWYQVTGGFGTTKSLWYQTIGGRQIAFFAGNTAPQADFITVPDDTFLNLDTVTSAQNNQIVNVNAYYEANTTPATPAGGTYNFATFTLTAPAGWSANIPNFVANTSIYISQAAFVGNSTSTVGPATNWTVPVVYSQQFQGNTGPAGTRGFVPMGYVITASDPATFSNANFTTAFSSSRQNPSPPIGLGFAPIANDTAQFAYTNLFTGNTTTIVKQYDGAGWNTVVGNVISGGLFVPGSINANTLNSNQVYALTIASTNADVGNVASNGFWLQSSTGDAAFKGNVNIGNNLYVGNLITAGTLNANVVTTNTIAYNAVTENQIQNNSVTNQKIVNQTIDAAKLVLKTITADQIANTTITGNLIAQNTITGNLIVPFTIFGNAVIANTLSGNTVIANTLDGNAIIANTIQANTIQGNAIVAGTITADKLAANAIVVGNITSTGTTLNDPTASGYWLNNVTGSVRFGGNTSIGNNLTVGNNAVIGSSAIIGGSASIGNNLTVGNNAIIGGGLTVSGLITSGNLQVNTVDTNNIVTQAVSFGNIVTTLAANTVNLPNGSIYYVRPNCNPSITITGATNIYVTGVMNAIFQVSNSLGNTSWQLTVQIIRVNPGGSLTTIASNNIRYYWNSTGGEWGGAIPFAVLDFPTTSGTYSYYFQWRLNPGSSNSPTINIGETTMTLQQLKR